MSVRHRRYGTSRVDDGHDKTAPKHEHEKHTAMTTKTAKERKMEEILQDGKLA